MTYRTPAVAALLGRPEETIPERLFPFQVTHPGSGVPHEWGRVDVAAALIWAVLDRTYRNRLAAYTLACTYGEDPDPPWVLLWPDRYLAVRDPERLPVALGKVPDQNVTALLFLDSILAPLRREVPA